MGIQVQNFNSGFIAYSINWESHLAKSAINNVSCTIMLFLGDSITSPSSRSSVDPESFTWLRTFGETQCFSAHTGHCHQQTANCPNHTVAPDVRWDFAETENLSPRFYFPRVTDGGKSAESMTTLQPQNTCFPPLLTPSTSIFLLNYLSGRISLHGVQKCSPLFTLVLFFSSYYYGNKNIKRPELSCLVG